MEGDVYNMPTDTFYDVHMHAFNLAHPCLNAFLRRFKASTLGKYYPFIALGAFILSIVYFPLRILNKRAAGAFQNPITVRVNRVKNLLSIMENNFLDYFLVVENCFRENQMLKDDGITIGSRKYARVVITPLMMDFGYKGPKDPDIHYKESSRKPIKEQTTDLLNAIKAYREFKYKDEYRHHFKNLAPVGDVPTERVLEIYPFLGINPQNNYSLSDMQVLLQKYFGDYEQSREQLYQQMGKFDGNIENVHSNTFAGIKLYPPLGFDPWPEEKDERPERRSRREEGARPGRISRQEQRDALEALYKYCEDKQIPITVHGSDSGFVTETKSWRLKAMTDLNKWDKVLTKYHLKLNIAHFPLNQKKLFFFSNNKRLNQIVNLIDKYPDVYTDISCRAFDEKYYKALKKFIENQPPELAEKLKRRIMFGSDFPVNLPNIESYNEYLRKFSISPAIKQYQHVLGSVNPASFMFGKIYSGVKVSSSTESKPEEALV